MMGKVVDVKISSVKQDIVVETNSKGKTLIKFLFANKGQERGGDDNRQVGN